MDSLTFDRTDKSTFDEIALKERIDEQHRYGGDDNRCIFDRFANFLRFSHAGAGGNRIRLVVNENFAEHELERVQCTILDEHRRKKPHVPFVDSRI